MKKEKTFTFDKNKKEYIIKLEDNKCPCWMFLITMILSLIFVIIILFVHYI